jgi:proteasome lid subunit RPN8/RPN11
VLILPVDVRRALVAQARHAQPLECCGLLIGRGRTVVNVFPTENVERSAVRFRVDPRAHIDAQRVLRECDPPLEILGSYHSHPAGPARPSPTDIAESAYPEWVHVIIGLGSSRPSIGGFRFREGIAKPVQLVGAAGHRRR